jgi:hypothetical protein
MGLSFSGEDAGPELYILICLFGNAGATCRCQGSADRWSRQRTKHPCCSLLLKSACDARSREGIMAELAPIRFSRTIPSATFPPLHRIHVFIAMALGAAPLAVAAGTAGADVREIPVPQIAAPLGVLPGPTDLPIHPELPDLFTADDGGKVATLGQWNHRREEMRRTLAYYAVGQSPPPPGNVEGRELSNEIVLDGRVRYRLIRLSFGPGSRLTLNVGVFTPIEGGPFPAIVLQGGTPPGAPTLERQPLGPTQGKGVDVLLPESMPAGQEGRPGDGVNAILDTPGNAGEVAGRYHAVFERGYALVVYNDNDCAEDTTLRRPDGSWAFRSTRFFPPYPGYDWGILAAWAWGASRIADYLESDPSIDPARLIITGASRAGKAAMIAAAFDDRFMAAPVVTGGGGIGAYRFAGDLHTETLDIMETKYPNWFSPHLHEFMGQRERLPFDQHWFLALCAPRPFLALEGDADPISSPKAVSKSVEAARAAYEFYGQEDRIGIHYSHHAHAFTDDDWTAMMDFGDAHLGRGGRQLTYDVRAFGAPGESATKDTRAFQAALDACAVNGGGLVDVPAGLYLIGSVQLGASTVLRLEPGSLLRGSPELGDYPFVDVRWEGRWQRGRRGLVYSAGVSHTAIIGPGRIEGSPWGTNGPDGARNPVVLEPVSCDDLRWDGFEVEQGGNWATHPTYCTHVSISHVTIVGQRDGIDVDSCEHVRITNCDIDTGDDSISIKSGRGMDGARLGRACEDVVIADCRLTDHRFACVGIGSETSGGVKGVRIERCVCNSGREAIYIKTRIGRGGGNEDIYGEDLDITAPTFLRINLTEGGNSSTADEPVGGLAGYPYARNVAFSRIKVAVKTLVRADEISALRPVHNFSVSDVTGHCTEGLRLANMNGVVLSKIGVDGLKGPLVSMSNVTGKGLEGAVKIPAPVDPPRGNAQGRRETGSPEATASGGGAPL